MRFITRCQAQTVQVAARTILAYVIYTSGSTAGQGCEWSHIERGEFLRGMDRVLGTTPGVWLAVTSISFDIPCWNFFGRWRAGSSRCPPG